MTTRITVNAQCICGICMIRMIRIIRIILSDVSLSIISYYIVSLPIFSVSNYPLLKHKFPAFLISNQINNKNNTSKGR